jgi:peptidoglycan/xylan/chitin deacetylase (PgdA/CDA1 family)
MSKRHDLSDCSTGTRPNDTIRGVAAMTAALVLVLGVLVSVPRSAEAESSDPNACNCVIFRLDDVQDNWLNTVQVKVMDSFIEENQKLSVGVIMKHLGNDESVVNKVEEGVASGNFEIVNHAWDHISYTSLSAEEQLDTLREANQKIDSLWGITPVAFIPPYHEYNKDTLAALQDLHMKIISSQFSLELPDVYNRNDPTSEDNKIYKAIDGSDISDSYGIYHLPQTIGYYDHGTSPHKKTSIEDIMNSIRNSISTYGYAVVTLHPQDFAVKDGNNNPTNEVSSSEIDDLKELLSEIQDNGYTTKTFSEVVDQGTNGGNNNDGGNGGGDGSDSGSGDDNSNGGGSEDNNGNNNNNGDDQGQQTTPQQQGGHRPAYNDYLGYFIKTYVRGNGTSSIPSYNNTENHNNDFLMGAYPVEYLFTADTTHSTHTESMLRWNNQYENVTVDDGPIMQWQDLTDGQKVWLIQTFDQIHSMADVNKLIASLTAGESKVK